MRFLIIFIACMAVLFQAGCTTTPIEAPEEVVVASKGSANDNLLAFYRQFVQSPLEAQRKEYGDLQAAYERTPDDAEVRVKYAMTLMMIGVPWRDDVRAQQILAGMEAEASAGKGDLIFLLDRMMTNRREEQKRCEQRLEGVREEKRRADQRADGLRDECKRAEQLQQKLDELRDIDRDLRSSQPTRRAKP